MAETRTPAPDQPTPPTPTAYGWCAWHRGYITGVRLIQAIEQGTGPGGGLYACGPCREVYGLTSFADQS